MTLASSRQEECNHSGSLEYLDPHEAPPRVLKDIFKSWRFNSAALAGNRSEAVKQEEFTTIPPNRLHFTFLEFFNLYQLSDLAAEYNGSQHGKIYCSSKIPGLLIAPALIPPTVQKELLSRLLHRDLSNQKYKTNLHQHFDVSYPTQGRSFFSENPSSVRFNSRFKNPMKNHNCKRALEKKLRWLTLGGQYDWSRKEYPENEAIEFPADISRLIIGLFPDIQPQAAILNLYSPGDTLSLHRDVSEKVDRGLVSISLGCDAYFVIGVHDENKMEYKHEVLLLHSGDVLYMTKESRFAWHGVPIILDNTCPKYLEDWPGDEFPVWKGWIQKKRINLNVRQMWNYHKHTDYVVTG